MFGAALGTTGWDGVGNLVGGVAVAGLADVETLFGVGLESAPGLLEQFQDVPLGNTLLDAAREDLRCALATQDDGLVRAHQVNAELFELVLDLSGDVGTAGDAFDGFTDHRVEPAVGPRGLCQQVLNTAIARDRDGEALMTAALTSCAEVQSAGLYVVEVRDDDRLPWQRRPAGAQLARNGKRRILLVLGGGTAGEGDQKGAIELPGQAGSSSSRSGSEVVEREGCGMLRAARHSRTSMITIAW
ncbi:hypothetical protein ACIBEJ_30540 [Nonomuraea sp. NPDC050790]|uniref:hypothetical protein n=1 Tax=Nonomuraea sp. NPDC050790 TaxID=3364371 RepID=UPI0037B20766